MKPIFTIAKRELTGFFASPVAYVFIVIFLLLSGFFTFQMSSFFERNEASLNWFFTWHPWLYIILVPAVGMGMWSDERRSGTIELLLTLPIAPWQAITGKFVASLVVIATSLALTFPMVITVNYLGHPDNGVIVAGYVGSFLVAASYLAVTAMISAMTRSQVISFIVSAVICLVLVLCGYPAITELLSSWGGASLVDTVAAFSVWTHFESIMRGVFDSRDLIYFLSVLVFSLFTTSVIIRARRVG